ncbi:MAG: adenine phosphoribosyltransferase [Gemmatimonadota bacterium]
MDQLVRERLRAIPDYPKPGILFQDITPVLEQPELFRRVTEAMAAPFHGSGITHVAGIEARGFILGGPIAVALGAGFIPIRKPGKLPWKSIRREYALEYGTNVVEVHSDAAGEHSRVLVVDDVLATGGTAAAAGQLLRDLGATLVAWTFLLELGFLDGRKALTGASVTSVTIL